MIGVIFMGDGTSHGGVVLEGSDRVTFDGRRAARRGDRVSCPKCGDNAIAEGDVMIVDGDLPLAFAGHKTVCGAALIAGGGSVGK